ncbi:MAG: nucleotidyl transferase AbiEii/AbiGii toxin family protein [Candidatus Margulisiibacteriota bacterium]
MEVLTQLQKEILNEFPKVSESGLFYLTGGTALAAFYLQHRKSNDLDFFTEKEDVILPFSFRLEENLKSKGTSIERLRGLHSFVELLVKKGTEMTVIHIAQEAPFRFEPPKEISEYSGLKIDSLTDIASNKLLALFQRATLRDFVDVYFLIKDNYFTKEKLMDLAREKDPGFDLYWFGVALERINFFKPNSAEMLLLIKPCTINELFIFFNNWREEISRDLK